VDIASPRRRAAGSRYASTHGAEFAAGADMEVAMAVTSRRRIARGRLYI
jgi:hypothetical protein